MSKADSIKARLRALAVQGEKPYEYIQTHYFIERILFRLSKSRFADDFILKGGLLLHALFENRSRATRDIDFLARQINSAPEAMILQPIYAGILSRTSFSATWDHLEETWKH